MKINIETRNMFEELEEDEALAEGEVDTWIIAIVEATGDGGIRGEFDSLRTSNFQRGNVSADERPSTRLPQCNGWHARCSDRQRRKGG